MKIKEYDNNDIIRKELGQRLKDIRIGSALRQEDIVRVTGLSASTVNRIEAGAPVNVDNVLSFMRALGLIPNLNACIPEQEVSPLDLVDIGHKRQRASKKKASNRKPVMHWKE